jgi:hypothetical protein
MNITSSVIRKLNLENTGRGWYDHTVTCMCDYRQGLDWWMDLLTTYTHDSELQVITSPTINLHSSQITTATAKPFPGFISRSPATASNSAVSSASRAQVLFSQPPVQKCLSTESESDRRSVWGLRPDFYYCETVAGLLMWGALPSGFWWFSLVC